MFMFKQRLAKEWPFKWFGFLGFEKEHIGKELSLEDYVDDSCPLEVRNKIVQYLKTSPNVIHLQQPAQNCGLCGELVYGSSYHSDGKWLWPDDLAHNVERHYFLVPNEMVNDILAADGIPPQEVTVPIEELPWP